MKPRIVIQFAVTAKEKRAIRKAASATCTSVSDFLRRAADERIASLGEHRKALAQFVDGVGGESVRT